MGCSPDRRFLSKYSPDKIRAALEQPAAEKLLSLWPSSRTTIMDVVVGLLQGQTTAQCDPVLINAEAQPLPSKLPVKYAGDVLGPTIRGTQEPRQLFRKYCAECHSQKSAMPFPLQGSLDQLKAYRSPSGASICSRLSGGTLMPPEYADLPLGSTDRAAMIATLGCSSK